MIQIPNDLVNIIATYATTTVTIDLITLSRDNARIIYSGVMWKSKLQYETRGQLLDPGVIEANKGTCTTCGVWWRYYLCKNRTFWGDVIRAQIYELDMNPVQVDLPGPVTGIGVHRAGMSYFVYQLDDLRLVIVESGSETSTPMVLPFVPRVQIRDFIPFSGDIILLTERGTAYSLESRDGEYSLKALDWAGDDLTCVGFLSRVSASSSHVALHRDRKLRTQSDEVSLGGSDVIELVGYSTLSVNGARQYMTSDDRGTITYIPDHRSPGEYYQIDYEGPTNGTQQYGYIRHDDIVCASFRGDRLLAVVGNRSVIRPPDQDNPIAGTKHRTQSIASVGSVGLILVDR